MRVKGGLILGYFAYVHEVQVVVTVQAVKAHRDDSLVFVNVIIIVIVSCAIGTF